jgi:hypothetical protein
MEKKINKRQTIKKFVLPWYVNIIIKNKKQKQGKTKKVQKYYTVGTVPNSNR